MRVKKYSGFLLDSLLESILVSTPEFRNILYGMPSDSKISDILYSIIDDKTDIKTTYNFINQTDKNDEISFIPDNQYQRFIEKGDDVLSKAKNKAKIGRMIRQILKDNGHTNFTEPDIEKFVNQFKSTWNRLHGVGRKIEVVTGDKIIHWYNEQNYYKSDGTLGNSCMRYPSKGNFMRLYADNPNKCSLLILRQDDKLLARALVWKLDDGRVYLDRIYSIQDSDMDFVYNWALQNLGNDNPNNLPSHFKGRQGVVKCTLDKVEFEEFPYADTMYYLYQEMKDGNMTGKGYVSNEEVTDTGKQYLIRVLQNTDGGSNVQNYRWSNYQSKYIYVKDSVWASDVDSYVDKDITIYNNTLGENFIKDLCLWSERSQEFIPKKFAIDHPDFGVVLKQMLTNVVIGYTGKETEPIKIWQDIYENGDNVLNKVQDLKRGGNFKMFRPDRSPNRGIDYDDKFKVTDYSLKYQVDFLCYELVEVSIDSVPEELQLMVFRYEKTWMTKIDSEVFGIKPSSDSKSWVTADGYIHQFSHSIYKSILSMIDKSDAPQNIKSRRIEIAELVDQKLRQNDSTYRYSNDINDKIWNILKYKLGEVDELELLYEIFEQTAEELESKWSFRGTEMSMNDYIDSAFKWETNEDAFEINQDQVKAIHKYFKVFLFFYIMNTDSYDARELLERFLRQTNEEDYDILEKYMPGTGDNALYMIRTINRYGVDDFFKYAMRENLEKYAESKGLDTRLIRTTFPEIIYNKISSNGFTEKNIETISKLVQKSSS